MADAAWTLRGEYMESCNCDYLCPCIYTNPQGPATHDHCYAMMVYRIDKGKAGAVALDDLHFAFVIRSGKVMADGGWIFACVVDEAADEAQRAALASIASGESGGVPGRIRENLVSDFRGVEYKPINFIMDGLKRATEIPEIFGFEIEGVASRNQSGDPYYIDNTGHPANTRLALATSKFLKVLGFGLTLDMQGEANNGHYAPFNWAS